MSTEVAETKSLPEKMTEGNMCTYVRLFYDVVLMLDIIQIS